MSLVKETRAKPLDVIHMDFHNKSTSVAAHVRDGTSGQYLHLHQDTITSLNEALEPTMTELTRLLAMYSVVK